MHSIYLTILGFCINTGIRCFKNSSQERNISQKAEEFSKKRVHAQPLQQRAYYLGVIAAGRKHWESTIEWAEKAAQNARWERTSIEARKGDVYYNLACNHARVAAIKNEKSLGCFHMNRCFAALKVAATIGRVKEDTVAKDYGREGDLYGLLECCDKNVIAMLEEVRPKLSRPSETQKHS